MKGSLAAPRQAYLRLLTLRTGEVFRRSRIQGEILRLEAFHTQRTGHEAKATPLANVDLERHVVHLDIEIKEQ